MKDHPHTLPENTQQFSSAELQSAQKELKNRIPFLIAKTFFALVPALLGISLIADGRVVAGIVVALLCSGAAVLQAVWLFQAVGRLKILKESDSENL